MYNKRYSRHRNLKPTKSGLSYVGPRSEFKTYRPDLYHVPKTRWTVDLPTHFAWSAWTLTNLEENVDGDLVLSNGELSGTAISPMLNNLTRHTTRYWDCSKVKFYWTHTLNEQKIYYYASNDGGSNWRWIKTADCIFRLNRGQEISQYRQSKYDDLRVKIEIVRRNITDTSPIVNRLVVKYNKTKI